MSPAKKRGRGRPPAGIGGKKSSQYRQLAVRVPDETIRQVTSLAASLELPQWQVVRNAIAEYFRATRPGSIK
jgi:hypothetical protein